MLKITYVSLDLSLYQRCCFHSCEADAAVQFTAKLVGGDVVYISACKDETHVRALLKYTDTLRGKRGYPERDAVTLSYVMIQPKGETKKCRLDAWLEDKEEPAPPAAQAAQAASETSAPPAAQAAKTPEVTCLTSQWKYIPVTTDGFNADDWMNTRLEVVKLRDLSNLEIQDAAESLLYFNFIRVPADLEWARQISYKNSVDVLNAYENVRPQLTVGTAQARKKLLAFKQEIDRRHK